MTGGFLAGVVVIVSPRVSGGRCGGGGVQLERPEPGDRARTNELDADEQRRMLVDEEGAAGLGGSFQVFPGGGGRRGLTGTHSAAGRGRSVRSSSAARGPAHAIFASSPETWCWWGGGTVAVETA